MGPSAQAAGSAKVMHVPEGGFECHSSPPRASATIRVSPMLSPGPLRPAFGSAGGAREAMSSDLPPAAADSAHRSADQGDQDLAHLRPVDVQVRKVRPGLDDQ